MMTRPTGLVAAFALLLAWLGPAAAEPQMARHAQMTAARSAHQATPLPGGQLLISGGCAGRCDRALASTELYDPKTRGFKPGTSMLQARVSHAAVALADGRVLVLGGWTGRESTASAEIYDPGKATFTSISPMRDARIGPLATLLTDGRVLVTGGETRIGESLASAEIFDPRQLSFTPLGDMVSRRTSHAAVRLSDGRVLLAGGHSQRRQVLGTAELFDPATNRFSSTGAMQVVRHKLAAASLPGGQVMIIGGSNERDGAGRYRSTEIYDPRSGRFRPGPDMQGVRHKMPDAVLALPGGALLVAGGGPDRPEIYLPAERRFVFVTAAERSLAQMFPTTSLLPSGDVLILGGYDDDIESSAAAWLITGLPR